MKKEVAISSALIMGALTANAHGNDGVSLVVTGPERGVLIHVHAPLTAVASAMADQNLTVIQGANLKTLAFKEIGSNHAESIVERLKLIVGPETIVEAVDVQIMALSTQETTGGW